MAAAPDAIERDFQEKVSSKLFLVPEGQDRYRVSTPFVFEDGDHLAVVLKRQGNQWLLTDEGHTFMHLTYDIDERDLLRGPRQKIISNALSAFRITDLDGELILPVRDERFGDALYSFVQALLKISDVTYLSRERVRSTFLEDFRSFLAHVIPEPRRTFEWHDPVRDPENKYTVDCRINHLRTPIFVYALTNEDKIRLATITLYQFERWGIPHRSIGIYEDQEAMNRKDVARFTDIADRQFSTLGGNQERIERYIKDLLEEENAKVS